MSKTLVVYFSRTGEQYSVGEITEGNTKKLAEVIAKKTSGDLFEIKVVEDNYPNKYTPLIQFAKKEKQENARPAIVGTVRNIDEYDTIFIGYPNWWADMPMPVYTFLDYYDLSNKTVHHFCTHEGSGGVRHDGFALYGHIAQNSPFEMEKKVDEWLKRL